MNAPVEEEEPPLFPPAAEERPKAALTPIPASTPTRRLDAIPLADSEASKAVAAWGRPEESKPNSANQTASKNGD